jgi:hypothetical protein
VGPTFGPHPAGVRESSKAPPDGAITDIGDRIGHVPDGHRDIRAHECEDSFVEIIVTRGGRAGGTTRPYEPEAGEWQTGAVHAESARRQVFVEGDGAWW